MCPCCDLRTRQCITPPKRWLAVLGDNSQRETVKNSKLAPSISLVAAIGLKNSRHARAVKHTHGTTVGPCSIEKECERQIGWIPSLERDTFASEKERERERESKTAKRRRRKKRTQIKCHRLPLSDACSGKRDMFGFASERRLIVEGEMPSS